MGYIATQLGRSAGVESLIAQPSFSRAQPLAVPGTGKRAPVLERSPSEGMGDEGAVKLVRERGSRSKLVSGGALRSHTTLGRHRLVPGPIAVRPGAAPGHTGEVLLRTSTIIGKGRLLRLGRGRWGCTGWRWARRLGWTRRLGLSLEWASGLHCREAGGRGLFPKSGIGVQALVRKVPTGPDALFLGVTVRAVFIIWIWAR